MSTWTLIFLIYAGAFAKGDSVAVHEINGFKDRPACIAFSSQLKPLVSGTAKEINSVCIERKP